MVEKKGAAITWVQPRFAVPVPDPIPVKFCLMSVRGSVRYGNVGTLRYGIPIRDRYGTIQAVRGGTAFHGLHTVDSRSIYPKKSDPYTNLIGSIIVSVMIIDWEQFRN